MLSGQQHAIAQLEQKHQRQLADLIQQLADAEERVKCEQEAVKAAQKPAEGSEAAHKKTKVYRLQTIGLSCMHVIICHPAAV